jgi:hypothetical protein
VWQQAQWRNVCSVLLTVQQTGVTWFLCRYTLQYSALPEFHKTYKSSQLIKFWRNQRNNSRRYPKYVSLFSDQRQKFPVRSSSHLWLRMQFWHHFCISPLLFVCSSRHLLSIVPPFCAMRANVKSAVAKNLIGVRRRRLEGSVEILTVMRLLGHGAVHLALGLLLFCTTAFELPYLPSCTRYATQFCTLVSVLSQ